MKLNLRVGTVILHSYKINCGTIVEIFQPCIIQTVNKI